MRAPATNATHAAALPAISESVWPQVPSGAAPGGAVWQTIRYETLHVHLAVPRGFRVEHGRLEFGHPVVNVIGPQFTAVITYASGRAHAPVNSLDAIVRRVATNENITDVYTRDGLHHVVSTVRGARCEIRFVHGDREAALQICATMRVPPPGRLGHATVAVPTPFPPIPEHATVVSESDVTVMHAGHFTIKVLPRACRSAAELRAAHSPAFELSERTLPHGPAIVGREHVSLADEEMIGSITVWATRQNSCCIATIPEFREPSAQQIDYVAQLCDATAAPR